MHMNSKQHVNVGPPAIDKGKGSYTSLNGVDTLVGSLVRHIVASFLLRCGQALINVNLFGMAFGP